MKLKLIAFPFAGGNKYSYDFLKPGLENINIDLVVLEYPGRGRRGKEPLERNIEKIVLDSMIHLKNEVGENDYFIYGHSMGALIGYLVCCELERFNLRKPLNLIVSGRVAPIIRKPNKKVYSYVAQEFWGKILELGGLPNEILQNKELLKYYEPILRADYECVEEFKYEVRKKINIPIDVYYGTDEPDSMECFLSWQEVTLAAATVEPIEGGHFFIKENQEFMKLFIQSFKN